MQKEFIYQIEKEEKENLIELTIYSVDSKKNTNLTKIDVSYSIFMKKDDFEALDIKSDNIILSDNTFFNKNKEEIIRLLVNSKELHEYILSQAKNRGFMTYEQDIPPEHQYLIDNDLKLIKNCDYMPLRYVSIDIESVGEIDKQEIAMISLYSPDKGKNLENLKKIYVNKEKINNKLVKEDNLGHKQEYTIVYVENEKELLTKFSEEIIKFEPQLILGWNVIDFDFKIIKERMDFHGVEFKFSSFEGNTKLRVFSDFFKNSTMTSPGVLILDVIALLKMNFIVFDDYKLDTVANEVLGDNKIELNKELDEEGTIKSKIQMIQEMADKNPLKLIEYNYKDSVLTSQIVEKLKLIELICKRSISTGIPLSKVKSPIATLDVMYLKKLHKKGFVASTNFNFSETNQIEGAYVIEPKKGFYKDIFVFDFKSLYPSIIMTFNVDPFTNSKSGQIEAPNGAKFDKEPGILPELIRKLYDERDVAKKENDKVMSHALKITMNSFYGAVASPKSRFYSLEVGEAITSFGREIIKKSKEFAEKEGHKAVYGDTDSVFIQFNKQFSNLDEKKKFGKKFEKKINEYFTLWVEEEFGQECFLSIEMEKIFSKFFIASKKRYVGYDEITSETMFTGMEAVRGDWTDLARSFQVNLVNLVFSEKKKEDIEKFILDFADEVRKGKHDDMLVYKKKLTKPLKEYTKTTPPHVKAARELKELNSRIVKYVMTKNGPKHISLVNDDIDYDYEHYIEKQLKGVSDDILESLGIDFDKVLMSKKQTNLDKFF